MFKCELLFFDSCKNVTSYILRVQFQVQAKIVLECFDQQRSSSMVFLIVLLKYLHKMLQTFFSIKWLQQNLK